MPKLNIMYDKWLPVIMIDETETEVSLYELITEAQRIKKLRKIGRVIIEEYIIYAFIFDFVQWVYKPCGYDEEDKKEAVLELFEKGCFNSELLDNYILNYEASGRSFDLFNKNYPFMQMSKKEWDDRMDEAKLTPLSSPMFGVGYISGNNVVFEHGRDYVKYETYVDMCKEKEKTEFSGKESYGDVTIQEIVNMKPAELFASILYCVAYKHASGPGSFTSVASSGISHPIFVVNEGKNLFETICLSIGISEEYKGRPLWERDCYLITSTEMMTDSMSDNVCLTYTPTVRIYPYDYSKIYASNFKKEDDKKNKNVYDYKKIDDKNFNTPKMAYAKWVEQYPRILRKRNETKDGKPIVEAVRYAHENLLDKNPVLETNLLQLESDCKECDIVNINYEVLKDKTDATIKFYGLAYKSASATNLTCFGKTFFWDKDINPYANLRLPKLLEFIATIAKKTAIEFTKLDYASRTRINDEKKINEATKKKISMQSLSNIDCVIKICLYNLENSKYDDLINNDKEKFKSLYDWIENKFLTAFWEYMNYLPRHSLLKYAEISENYRSWLTGIKKKYKED